MPPDPAPTPFATELAELIGIGMEVARLVQAETRALAATPVAAEDAAPQGPGRAEAVAAVAVAFDRVARAVRRTIMLAQRAEAPAAPGPALRTEAARRHVLRTVEDRIGAAHGGNASGKLRDELHERLDGPDVEADLLLGRPTEEIIREIVRDLGLETYPGVHPWQRRTPDDIAALCRRAERPAAPDRPAPAVLTARPPPGAQRLRL